MTGYLLDTNVISELSKRHPHPAVVQWTSAQSQTYLSVLTIGEILQGVERLRPRDTRRAEQIAHWAQQVQVQHRGRVLDVDHAVVTHWSTLPASRTLPVIDSLIAATALANGLVVATRNVEDFADAGVGTINPFQ